MPILTAIDVLGVQRYIFLSNRLKDVVTGSWLVQWSTSRKGALDGLIARNKILLAGGGNAIVEIESMEKACDFTAKYTRLLYDRAPGLETVIVHHKYEPGKLAASLLTVQVKLAKAKTERIPSVPLLGLSVTASCRETGLPANDVSPTHYDDEDPNAPLSCGILKRREKLQEANFHWNSYLNESAGNAFPLELDQLGRTYGDTSLIGVVHVDGNGIGKKIEAWLQRKNDEGAPDNKVLEEYRVWSKAIDKLGVSVFQAVVDRIERAIESSRKKDECETRKIIGKPSRLGFDLKYDEKAKMWWLPVRPILLGGDDLTFVCDGRIALDLAATVLKEFDKSSIPYLDDGKITACAGIAFARVHAPIARTYEMAERLCASAKEKIKRDRISECALDWHIGQYRPGESVDELRQRQYCTNKKLMTCRPYRLGGGADEVGTWRWFSETLLGDGDDGLRGKKWSARRNKVKTLAEIIREGPDGVQKALKAWQIVDSDLKFPEPINDDEFNEARTPLLDAIELYDLHLVLEPQSESERGEEKKP